MTSRLPTSASVVQATSGDLLHAPSAARNLDALVALLRDVAPPHGHALELASGTGQHVTGFAGTLPLLHWHPTEVDPARLRSIDAHIATAGLPNVAAAQKLDASRPGWAGGMQSFDLVFLSNLLHLIPASAARTVVAEASTALRPGGRFVIYGPFSRDGKLTSAGDIRFDADLRAADPAIGYKDVTEVTAWLVASGCMVKCRDMPANNLALVATRKE